MDTNLQKPLVTVVIPTYNRCEYVCEAIESVLAQTYQNIEVIVVDDESTDDTRYVVPERFKERIRFLRQENSGVSAARNYALEYALGRYVAFLDDDDLWLPTKLEKEMDVLLNNPDLGFVYSGAFYIDEHGKVVGQRERWDDEVPTFERLFRNNIILSPSLVTVKRECLIMYGVFDEDIWQSADYDLWLRIAKYVPFDYVDENLIYYRIHPRNMSKNWDQRLHNHMMIFSKPEIMEGKGFFGKLRRKANSFHYIAGECEKNHQYFQAARKYARAVLFFPFIGMDYWPNEAKRFRFSLPYRILKPYLLIGICFVKSIHNLIMHNNSEMQVS